MVYVENIESEILAKWLRYEQYMFTHIANESWLPPKVAMLAAKRKKRMGLSPWFPDFCIILKSNALLFIELKREIDYSKSKKWKKLSTTSIEQKEWCELLNKCNNVQAEICYWAKESIKLIQRIELIKNTCDI